MDGSNNALDPTDNTLDPTDVPDVERLDTPSTVVIEEFPFGSPGAPIPDKPRGTPGYASAASHQDALADSIWAPFQSQHDWAIARWAKMCGPTSTAVTELLAIPEVWMLSDLRYRVTKSTALGCRFTWPFISHDQSIEQHH